jgi:hypothetical protein
MGGLMSKNTLDALNSLAGQVPGMNERALRQTQAARDIALQKQIGAAPTSGVIPQAAQQVATQRALQAGQDIIRQRQQAAQQAAQIQGATFKQKQRQQQMQIEQDKLDAQRRQEEAELKQFQELKLQERESRAQLLDEEIAAEEALARYDIEQDNRLQLMTLNQRKDLNRIAIDAKEKMADEWLRFKKDEQGRKFTQSRQLAAWNLYDARDRQDFDNRMSNMMNAFNQKTKILEHSQAQITAVIKRGFIKEQDDLDHEMKKKLAKMKHDIEMEKRRIAAEANNTMGMWRQGGKIIGTVAGGVLGGIYGGPAGAAAGATAGGGVGEALGSSLGAQQARS